MTYIRELPNCAARFGRTSMVEKGEKLVPRLTLACGYREVEPEECIICSGFKNVKLEMKIHTFLRIIKGKRYKIEDKR